jgi:hypothetical protein
MISALTMAFEGWDAVYRTIFTTCRASGYAYLVTAVTNPEKNRRAAYWLR